MCTLSEFLETYEYGSDVRPRYSGLKVLRTVTYKVIKGMYPNYTETQILGEKISLVSLLVLPFSILTFQSSVSKTSPETGFTGRLNPV